MNSMVIALLILAATIALFIWEPIPIVVTAIGASILYAYTGIIEVNTIFSGYNSSSGSHDGCRRILVPHWCDRYHR